MKKKIINTLFIAILFSISAFSQTTILKVGDKAPELILNSLEGKPIALSSLEGKVVLIYFWGAFNKTARIDNKVVLKAYNEFKDATFKVGKGFDVYAISIDSDESVWKRGIMNDSLFWPNHVCELKGWGSKAMQAYDIYGVPFTFLIDGEKKIIAIGLRGETIIRKLYELQVL